MLKCMELKFIAVQNFMSKVNYHFEKFISFSWCLELNVQACGGNTHVIFISVPFF